MPPPTPELADIFRQYGPAYRQAHSLPLHQERLMQAIEDCRTPALGGSVDWCDHCQFTHTRYRSCRNRHCPKCQGAARETWIEHVLEYLGRYTHRVAISNRRLLNLEDGQVSFQWKDYRDEQQQKVMTVSADDFIRRFLQHALPPGFQRIRYYGFLANCHRADKLDLCRRLLATSLSQLLPALAACHDFYASLTARNPRRCPNCGIGILTSIQFLWPCPGPLAPRLDTS
jgi:hypothetical protein